MKCDFCRKTIKEPTYAECTYNDGSIKALCLLCFETLATWLGLEGLECVRRRKNK